MATPNYDKSPGAYSIYLANLLRTAVGVELPSDFERTFLGHATRIGPGNYEDLGSWLLLECLRLKAEGVAVDSAEVLRALDRIRHRVSRRVRREIPTEATAQTPDRSRLDNEKAEGIIREFRGVLEKVSGLHVLVFERLFLDGEDAKQVAAELGVSLATLYRRATDVKNEFKRFREGGNRLRKNG